MPANEVVPVTNGTTNGTAVHPLEDLQLRMAKVEELLGISPGPLAQAVEKTAPQMLGMVVVKGDRSVYHGQNDRVTLLNQVCFDQ